jgi:hypothetical protein
MDTWNKSISNNLLVLQNSSFYFELDAEDGGVKQFKRVNDSYDTNYIKADDDNFLGDIIFKYVNVSNSNKVNIDWESVGTRNSIRTVKKVSKQICIDYKHIANGSLGLKEIFELDDMNSDALIWKIIISNNTVNSIRLGDIALPLPFNQHYVEDTITTYTKRVIRHSFISGNSSFLYWCRPNGIGPYLVFVPVQGTHLEYYDRDYAKQTSGWEGPYKVYIHSEVTGKTTSGTWKQPHTGVTIAPGETISYTFKFQWANDLDQVREVLYDNGLVDVYVAPGMTLPKDLKAKVALRTQKTVSCLKSEYPNDTKIEYIGIKNNDTYIYEIQFSKIGENRITIHYGDNEKTYLEFFSTKSIEELIKKRASHIKNYQQYRGVEWYNGLFSQWDMESKQMTYPGFNLGLHEFCVGGADDPGLCKAPFIAQKNLHFPNRGEIESVEYYIENFVWGGLQRTSDEIPYPYGIYGSDNWYENRNSGTGYSNGGHGQERMWRTFDYTHVIQLYYTMYKIAKKYTEMVHYLDAQGYLERAYFTAKAFYEVPYSIYMKNGWSFEGYTDWAFKQGNFHELNIPWLVQSLYDEGKMEWADEIKYYWESKVKYMVYDDPYPFCSEMCFDSTAFESTHAVAKYGLENDILSDDKGFYDKNYYEPGKGKWISHENIRKQDFIDFMEKEMVSNLAARNCIEPAYYLMGSDIRQHGNTNYMLSYMTQMGGWSIVDYALYYSKQPERYMHIGYASYLGSWALVNTGYDYPWWPGEENEGAAAWGFEPEKFGPKGSRGPWRFDGEIDNGLSGALRTSCTVVVDDPIFGLFAYGGDISRHESSVEVIPKDGLRQRFHMLHINPKLHMCLDRDGFDKILVNDVQDKIEFILENRTGDAHLTELTIKGLQPVEYILIVEGLEQARFTTSEDITTVNIPVNINATCSILIRKA